MSIHLGFGYPFKGPISSFWGNWADLRRRSITIPDGLMAKLDESNRHNLGSELQQGTVFATPVDSDLLTIVNAYLVTGLTDEELQFILKNRDYFEFRIGVGDRRSSFYRRFAIAQNWAGSDSNQLLLKPDPYTTQPYSHLLTFVGGTGHIKVTDTHSGDNRYGSVRYITVSYSG